MEFFENPQALGLFLICVVAGFLGTVVMHRFVWRVRLEDFRALTAERWQSDRVNMVAIECLGILIGALAGLIVWMFLVPAMLGVAVLVTLIVNWLTTDMGTSLYLKHRSGERWF